MHLAIEAIGTEARGGSVVLGQLLDACSRHSGVDRVTLFCDVGLAQPPRRKVEYRPQPAESPVAKLNWAVAGWAATLRNLQADVALSFNGFAQAPDQFVFVHNALLFDPITYRLGWPLRQRLRVLRRLTDLACREAQGVFVQTQTMASYVRSATGVEPQVFTPRRSPAFGGLPSDFEGAGPRLLFVGSEVPHKDAPTFERAVGLLKRLSPDVIMVGNFRAQPDPPVGRWLGNVGEQHLGALYRDADVLVQTSMCESLGLPLLEAMSSGLSVVVADRAYAREVCGEAALYFAPGDAQSCAEAIKRALDVRVSTRLRELGLARHNQIGSGAYPDMVNRMLGL